MTVQCGVSTPGRQNVTKWLILLPFEIQTLSINIPRRILRRLYRVIISICYVTQILLFGLQQRAEVLARGVGMLVMPEQTRVL